MKKFSVLAAASVLALLGGTCLSAQSRYGVIGGMSFSTSNFSEMNRATMTLWHVGLTYKYSLPLGFAVQPSLIYQNKGAKTRIYDNLTVKTSYIELPVSLQWGPDLLVCRPFLDFTPFIGYAMGCKAGNSGASFVKIPGEAVNRFEYGVGVGVGLEIWRFQVIGRYMWNFGGLTKVEELSDTWRLMGTSFNDRNYRGFMLSVAFLFGGKTADKK